MPQTQQSAVELRHIIVGTLSSDPSDSLVGINTTIYPDGCLAYVVDLDQTFRLRKSETPPASPPLTVAPQQGPGLWELQGSDALAELNCYVIGTTNFTAAGAISSGQNVWTALQSGVNFYIENQASAFWALDTGSGVLTYNGPSDARFQITANFSLQCDGTDTIEVDTTINQGLIGSQTPVQTSIRTNMATSSDEYLTSHVRILTLTKGQQLQYAYRDVSPDSSDVHFTRLQIAIVCIGL